MRKPERPQIPDWAKQERARDMEWIGENLYILWPAAQQSYKEQGRGAIVVDTTIRAPGAGNPFYYMAETGVEKLNDADALRMVKGYDPSWEMVTMLFKSEGKTSTYRVGVLPKKAGNGV